MPNSLGHIVSGIRTCYVTSESYDGDTVDYNLKDIFIITKDRKRLTLVDIDLKRKVFLTPDKQIRFSNVSMFDE